VRTSRLVTFRNHPPLALRSTPWVAKGAWAVADQGLFALANFVVSVLLARWLSPSDYGAFGIAFSVLLLLGAVHGALLTEPMLVFGPARFRDCAADYLRRLVVWHFAVTVLMAVIVCVFVATYARLRPDSAALGVSLAAMAVSSPGVLLLWMMRRACYIDSQPRAAAVAGMAYLAVTVPAIVVEEAAGVLSPASAFLTMAGASVSVAWWLRTRVSRQVIERRGEVSVRVVGAAHLRYGRWALGSAILSWVPGNVVILLLPLWYSLQEAGVLKVALTLSMPVLQLLTALGTLLLPALVRARSSGRLAATAGMAQAVFLAMALASAPLTVALGPWLVNLLFGAQYELSRATLSLVAALPVAVSISLVSAGILRAMERPDRVLWTYVASTAVTCSAGLLLVYLWGVNGALASLVLSASVAAIVAKESSRRLTAEAPGIADGEVSSSPL
jgi:O-antigen/teichoic acid export membrane protein